MEDVIDLRPSDTSESLTAPPPPPFVQAPNQELIFHSVEDTAVIDTEPVYLTCDQSQVRYHKLLSRSKYLDNMYKGWVFI